MSDQDIQAEVARQLAQTAPEELTEFRERYGGDSRAINRHSVRVYEFQGSFWKLDKTCDGAPPFFNLEELPFDPRKTSGMGQRVKVEGADYWGDGYSWPKAEKAAFAVIVAIGAERSA
jgi:hypothetical protein